MLLLALLFVGVIIVIAFYLNSVLDKREVRRLSRDAKKRDDAP